MYYFPEKKKGHGNGFVAYFDFGYWFNTHRNKTMVIGMYIQTENGEFHFNTSIHLVK